MKRRITFRSGFEKRVEKNLQERGISHEYESIKLKYVKSTCPCCKSVVATGSYTPDFIVARSTGKRLVVEGKGRFTSSDRTKMLSVVRDNPEEDIRMLFQKDDPITKGSKTRNSGWCHKHQIPCAIGEAIPDSWL